MMESIRDVFRKGLHGGLSVMPPEDRLAAAWLVVCGRALAERGIVVGYSDGVVHVKVRDGAWIEPMKSMGERLEVELARVAGVKVSEIHFLVRDNDE